jgi:phage gp29-like protein
MDLKKTLQTALKKLRPGKSFAEPEESGPRTVVTEPVANNLTPERLARILKEAVEGDPADFFELAQEMEERDGHYGSVLATRKLTILGIEPELHAASEDPADEAIAEAVREDILDHPEFGFFLSDMLDALGKGVAVIEVLWDTSGPRWKPGRFEWVDPRWITFDKKTRREIRLKEKDKPEGVELPPLRYVTHRPRIKSGLPIRGGLARLAVWSWLLKSYTVKDWAAFCEIFGQPLRLGKYGAGASDKDKRALLRAVRSIARDAAAIIPDTMDMELIQTKASGGAVFKEFAEFLDGQVSKAVLGQTITTDDGSSMAQAEVHDGVRMDIAKADARALAKSINDGLIIPYCQANFGARDRYPGLKLDIDEPEDLDLASKVLDRLIKAGLELAADEVRDKFGYRKPEAGEDVIGGKAATDEKPAQAPGDKTPDEKPAAANRLAINESHDHTADQHLRDVIALGLAGWQDQGDPMLQPIEDLLNQSASMEEFLERLPSVIGDQNMGPLTDSLAGANLAAEALGEAGPD